MSIDAKITLIKLNPVWVKPASNFLSAAPEQVTNVA